MLPILVKEPVSAAVDAFMSTVQQPWVSDFAAGEVASALSRLVRTGRLQASDGAACLSDFDVWRAAMTRSAETHAVRCSPGRRVCPAV
jgi:predicted nucleic acid-binding protein